MQLLAEPDLSEQVGAPAQRVAEAVRAGRVRVAGQRRLVAGARRPGGRVRREQVLRAPPELAAREPEPVQPQTVEPEAERQRRESQRRTALQRPEPDDGRSGEVHASVGVQPRNGHSQRLTIPEGRGSTAGAARSRPPARSWRRSARRARRPGRVPRALRWLGAEPRRAVHAAARRRDSWAQLRRAFPHARRRDSLSARGRLMTSCAARAKGMLTRLLTSDEADDYRRLERRVRLSGHQPLGVACRRRRALRRSS